MLWNVQHSRCFISGMLGKYLEIIEDQHIDHVCIFWMFRIIKCIMNVQNHKTGFFTDLFLYRSSKRSCVIFCHNDPNLIFLRSQLNKKLFLKISVCKSRDLDTTRKLLSQNLGFWQNRSCFLEIKAWISFDFNTSKVVVLSSWLDFLVISICISCGLDSTKVVFFKIATWFSLSWPIVLVIMTKFDLDLNFL